MKTRIARNILIAVGLAGLAGTPALFAGDFAYDRYNLRHDHSQLRALDADIRADQFRLREDLEHGRYRDADRTRADLSRDYRQRDRDLREIRHDRRDLHANEYDRYGWR
jgi:hypothetical protein